MTGFLLWFVRSKSGRTIVLGLAIAAGLFLVARGIHQAGQKAEQVRQLRETLQVERKRNEDDAHLQSLSDYDLCVEYLDARGMSADPCEQLRGLPGE